MWQISGDFKYEADFKSGLKEIFKQKRNFKVSGILIYKQNDKSFRESVNKVNTWINLHNESGEEFLVFCFKDSTVKSTNDQQSTTGFITAIGSSTGPREVYDRLFNELFGRKIVWDHSPVLVLETKDDDELTIFRLPQRLSTAEYDSYLPKLLNKISEYVEENPECNSRQIGNHISENHQVFQIYSSALAYLPSKTKIIEFIQKIIGL